MTESNHSHTQQSAHAWKKLVDGQLDLMSSLHDHVVGLRDQGLEQGAFAFDELTRITKESSRQASELFATQQRLDAWKSTLDKQVEHATVIADKLSELQGERIEQTRGMLDAFTKMSKSSIQQAAKLSKAWQDIAVGATERATSWTSND